MTKKRRTSVERHEDIGDLLEIPAKLPEIVMNLFSGVVSGVSALGVAGRLVSQQPWAKGEPPKKGCAKGSAGRRRH